MNGTKAFWAKTGVSFHLGPGKGGRAQKSERRDPTTSEKAREWVFRTCVIILSALSCFRDNNKALLLAVSLIGAFVP